MTNLKKRLAEANERIAELEETLQTFLGHDGVRGFKEIQKRIAELEADLDKAMGRYTTYDNMDDFIASLDEDALSTTDKE